MATFLNRELFETKRQLEYFSDKELSMQLGADPPRWGVTLLKELVDNALDACETAGTPPAISVALTPEGFTVADNGPGMPAALIERSLDYNVRVSDKTYYVSPSRGQLGNALKCLWAAPYAVAPEAPGSVEVESLGVRHHIRFTVNRIAQEPRCEYLLTQSPICKKGTSVTVLSPKVAKATACGTTSQIFTNQGKHSSRHTPRLTPTPRSPYTPRTCASPIPRRPSPGRSGARPTRPRPDGMRSITSPH